MADDDWWKKYVPAESEIDAMADPEFIVRDLIISSHFIAIVAPPNGGKTTILTHLSGEMAADGYRVIYVNADIGAGDAKPLYYAAQADGYTLLLPDLVGAGVSVEDVIEDLKRDVDNGTDMTETVFIFDTLKKILDVNNKRDSKMMYKLFRAMTAKGATVIILAHTNKYPGEDGKLVYEGVGDLRSDTDDLIMLYPRHEADGSMTVTAEPIKTRGAIQPTTFAISADRRVTRSGYRDVRTELREEQQRERDQPIVEAISDAISNGNRRQVDITTWCKRKNELSRRDVRGVLKRYRDIKWTEEDGAAFNTKVYTLK